MNRIIFIFLSIGISQYAVSQTQKEFSRWTLGIAVSPDSYRYAPSRESGLHYQTTLDRKLNEYLVLGAYVGIQNRSSSFRARYIQELTEFTEIEFEKQYIPVGFRFGFDLTTFFSNTLGWIKNQSKWEVLLLGYGGVTIQSLEITTPQVPGRPYDESEYPWEEDMNYIAGLNAVIRYFPIKNLGISTEIGTLPVGRYSFGVAYRLR
jgi:hypothetical protein